MAKGKVGRDKKNEADLSMGYIIKKIATSTDLTAKQITESVVLYFAFIEEYLKSSVCPKDVKIQTPIGKFMFKERKGLEVGSTYKTPIDFGKTKDENGNPIFKTVTVEEKHPDYLKLWFEVSPTLQTDLRSISEERWCKKNAKR